MQAVRQNDGHCASQGKKDEFFTTVRDSLVRNMPPATCRCTKKPIMKILRDKFRSMLADRREETRKHINRSAIAEELGPVDLLPDNFIAEVNEAEKA